MSTDRVDLHMHSTASDGTHRPAELVEMARTRGLRAIALTDHDTIDGVEEFLAAAEKSGVEAIAGVEVGIRNETERGLKEVHILAYFIKPGDHPLAAALEKLQAAKVEWSERQVARLEAEGFTVPYDEVLEVAAASPTVRRPHIWKVAAAHNPHLDGQTYFRNTDFGGPWYVKKRFELSLEETVALITESGAIPVLAHPAFYGSWPVGAIQVLDYACAAGIRGVEAIYAYDAAKAGDDFPAQADVAARLLAEARQRGLLVTGGSDFHGGTLKSIDMGCVEVPYQCVVDLRSSL